MAKLRASRVNRTVLGLAVCVGSVILGFTFRDGRVVPAKARQALQSQRSDQKMLLRYDAGNEPVVLDSFRVKDVKIAPGRKFSIRGISEKTVEQREDWLENLEFEIKNVSDKQINFILLKLHFPEAIVSGARMVYYLEIGIDPEVSAAARNPKHAKRLALDPGDTFTFILSTDELQQIKAFLALENYQLADLNQLAIVLGPVIFDNGMKWDNRNLYKPNPRAPGGYERVNQIRQ